MNMTWETDTEFELVKITGVRAGSDGWEIIRHDGWIFYVEAKHGVEPKVGDLARFYGRGIGGSVRGLVLGGRVVYYRTAQEDEVRRLQEVADQAAARRRAFEADHAALDAAYAVLPLEFRRRLDGFRARNPEYRWEYEGYESFVCTEAVKLIVALGSAGAVEHFHGCHGDEQKRLVPGVAYSEHSHSGNTFGAACFLAHLYMIDPERVERAHGAICPLVGCETLGCWAMSGEARTVSVPEGA